MPEEVINRINNLMDMTLQRLETEVASAPPDVMQHTAVSVLNLYSLKETLSRAESRSRLEEQAIKEFVKAFRNGGPPPGFDQTGPRGPGVKLP